METREPLGPSDSEAGRWNELLDGLDAEALTDAFLSRVLELEDYRGGPLPAREIRRTGTASFEALIAGLRPGADREALAAEQQDIALEVGVSRARAGIPVASLMTAIRQDFTVLWEALRAEAGPDDAPLLVRQADSVWRIVDAYASLTQVVYLQESQRMALEASSARQAHLAALLGPAAATPAQLDAIAEGLGVDGGEPLAVAVALGEAASGLRIAVAQAERRGAVVMAHPSADGLTAFWSPGRPGSAAADATERIGSLPCGLVEPVDGLAGVWAAARLARELALLADPEDGPATTLDDAWPRIARLRLADAGVPLGAPVEAALAGCGPAERTRLVEAVGAYLDTGSVAEACRRVYCHRNTLMNRLRRFADLTGIDPTVPREAARLVIAWA